MKSYGLIIAILGIVFNLKAQNAHVDFKSAIKFYNLSSYEESAKSSAMDQGSNYLRSSDKNLRLLHPTIAFMYKNRRSHFEEIELTNMSLATKQTLREIVNDSTGSKQVIERGDVYNTSIALRYEYIKKFDRFKGNFIPSLGLGIGGFFNHNKFTSGIPAGFPSKETVVGARGYVIPRLTYYISSRCFVDLNVPLCILEVYNTSITQNNPDLSKEAQAIDEFGARYFPKIVSGRIGFGVKI